MGNIEAVTFINRLKVNDHLVLDQECNQRQSGNKSFTHYLKWLRMRFK